jgi:hypothetical protein
MSLAVPKQISLLEYDEEVLAYLEYLGFPEYVQCFESNMVAESITTTIIIFWGLSQSYRMCALSIFGLTLTANKGKNEVIH